MTEIAISPPLQQAAQPRPAGPSVYDIPAPPISDVEVFLKTFVRLFAYSSPPQKHLSKTPRRIYSSPPQSRSDIQRIHLQQRLCVVPEEPAVSSPSSPVSSSPGNSPIFGTAIFAGRTQDLFRRAPHVLSPRTDNAGDRNAPVPEIPLPPLPALLSTDKSFVGKLSGDVKSPGPPETVDYVRAMQEIENLELLVSTRAPPSRYVSERSVSASTTSSEPSMEDVENWNSDVEDSSDGREWFFIPAPNPSILDHSTKVSKKRTSSPSIIRFRAVDFQAGSTSSAMSATTATASSVAKTAATSPTSIQPTERLAADEDDAISDIEALIADPTLTAKKVIAPARKRLSNIQFTPSNIPYSLAGYVMTSPRRAPGQQSFSSVTTSGTTATTTTSGSAISLLSSSPGVDPLSVYPGKNKPRSGGKTKSKPKHLRFSSKQRAQSDTLGAGSTAGEPAAIARSNSESPLAYSTTTARPSKAQAPYGDGPNTSYYVLTSMGVKLVTPGKEDGPESPGEPIGITRRKESTSSSGSGSASGSWFFGRKSRGSQGSGGSK
ncbi:hypothetical protein POJ06DRAFT_253355 [Lipomyces tetrasporus]|uniref:Uncharacterized protein n=1 Tax=Lipomyces tetrasporus TaxID=54092 RepID=A0AAD7VT57_9ASCO|nr:uncharacterized protein POJ06DRAFT_253355 [Lipomyces tetrasporus]KAJ8100661.1 hypothetical protein POJ06DRAFT_253355 [Lipomyces tetrasporus]